MIIWAAVDRCCRDAYVSLFYDEPGYMSGVDDDIIFRVYEDGKLNHFGDIESSAFEKMIGIGLDPGDLFKLDISSGEPTRVLEKWTYNE